ncbi:hypothetical protein D3C72_2194360 [compost metagenome]
MTRTVGQGVARCAVTVARRSWQVRSQNLARTTLTVRCSSRSIAFGRVDMNVPRASFCVSSLKNRA